MDSTTVYGKTAKGVRAVTHKDKHLSGALLRLLSLVDGKSSVDALAEKSEARSPAELRQALDDLAKEGYVKVLVSAPVTVSSFNPGASDSIDVSEVSLEEFIEVQAAVAANRKRAEEAKHAAATHRTEAPTEATERARKEGERQARLEAERKAREAAEARARKEAEELARREAAEKARIEAEKRARLEAERQARTEAERIAREEARAKAEAEEQARREAEEKARAEAEDAARLEAERQAREAAEQAAREEADARARAEAEEQARREAEEKARAEAEEAARLEAERQAREAAERAAREEADARARAEAEELARREAEEKALVEAAEAARLEAERQAREAAEQAAREEADARARAEAEELARREAEEKARVEAAEAARLEAERQAREAAERAAREEADARARAEAEEQARREAEEKARVEAAEAARLEAERQAREAAEQAAREEADARARAETEEQTRRDAENAARRAEAEARAKEEAKRREQEKAERRARKEAEAMAKEEARKRAQKEAERTAQAKAEARAREKAQRQTMKEGARRLRGPLKLGRIISISLFVLVVLPLVLLHTLSLGFLVAPIEKLASDRVHEPVSIGSVRASLWPSPHLRLTDVSVGPSRDVKIAAVRVMPVMGTLLGDTKTLESLELESLALDQDGLKRIPGWVMLSSGAEKVRVGRIALRNAQIAVPGMALPPLDGEISLTPAGGLAKAHLRSGEGKMEIEVTPAEEEFAVRIAARDWHPPLGPLTFEELSADATASREGMRIRRIDGRLYGGALTGSAIVNWSKAWNAEGEFGLSNLNLEEASRALAGGANGLALHGRLDTKGTYSLEAPGLAGLVEAPRIKAGFSGRDGTLVGIDLGQGIQGRDGDKTRGGTTRFDRFTGNLDLAGQRFQLRQMKLEAGQLRAAGDADVAPDGGLSGKISVEVAVGSSTIRSRLTLSGNLKQPVLKKP